MRLHVVTFYNHNYFTLKSTSLVESCFPNGIGNIFLPYFNFISSNLTKKTPYRILKPLQIL